MKKIIALALCLLVLLCAAGALAETTFDGTVVASESVSVTAPFGGTVSAFSLRAGGKIALGDPIATIETTKVYASASGTVTGVFGQVGDATEDVAARSGAVLYIVPERKYSVSCDIEKAYNSSETKYVNIGETVYLCCVSDGDHTAVGVVTAADGTAYTVETTSGELMMQETVNVYRSEKFTAKSRVGRGTVSRTAEIAVGGSGSILYMHVTDGQQVERGQLLFETVTGTFDGLYATSNQIVSDVSGVIASVDVSAGSTVSKGATLITVYPENSFQIETLIGEYDLAAIREGDRVNLTFNWDEENKAVYEGVVAMISHVSEESSGSDEASYKAYVDFTPDAQVRMGMTVIVGVAETGALSGGGEDAAADADDQADAGGAESAPAEEAEAAAAAPEGLPEGFPEGLPERGERPADNAAADEAAAEQP